jgi:rhodanese-related sulfurtransferase
MVPTITLSELKAKLDAGEDVTLVEALGPMPYEEAHLPGAINIPHEQVDELAATLLRNREAQIVVYCANGPCKNSGIATKRLLELGYPNVRDYHEGKAEWVEAGLPTESGAAARAA